MSGRTKVKTRSLAPLIIYLCLFAIGASLFAFHSNAQETDAGKEGVILTLNGAVTPPVADYLEREIEKASESGKELIIIEIDTPGGLMSSMQSIIKSILGSETPVATYVSPQGAKSASAGLYIMYSAHISAMAPATNTGAATPIEIGGGSQDDPRRTTNPSPSEGGDDAEEPDETRDAAPSELRDQDRSVSAPLSNDDAMRAKIINDSVAYIRALAEERGRNADWAESAVRDAVSVSANEALQLGVIDLIADDIDDLLKQINGRTVSTPAGDKVLATENIRLERIEPTMVEKILSFIADPNVAVILMSLATTGIIIEMWNPGSILPGVVGLTCLALGLYSFQVLPFNWLPLVLMGIGVVMIIVEAYTPTFGISGLFGLILMGVGMYFLFPESIRVSPAVIGTMLAIVGGFLAIVMVAIVGSRSHGPLIGGEAVRKREGVVDDWDGREGWVIVEGERWRARADKPLSPGDRIRVVEIEGLVLVVKQAKANGLLGGFVTKEA